MSYLEQSLQRDEDLAQRGKNGRSRRGIWYGGVLVLSAVAVVVAVLAATQFGLPVIEDMAWEAVDGTAPAGQVSSAADVGGTTADVAAPQPAIAQTLPKSRREAEETVETSTANTATGVVAIAGVDGLDLWSRVDPNLRLSFPAGTLARAVARSQDEGWLKLTVGPTASGWVQADLVIAYGIERLPVEIPDDVTGPAGAEAEASPVEGQLSDISNRPGSVPVNLTDTVAERQQEAVTVTTLPQTMTGVVTLTESRLNVRAGPDSGSLIIGKVYPEDRLRVLGRNASGDWLRIELPDQSGAFGWVSSTYVDVNGSMDEIPISEEYVGTASPAWTADRAPAQRVESSAMGGASGDTGLNGTLVFQSSPGGMIYAYQLETRNLQELTHGFDPAISPDGTTVAFTRDGGENGLYLIDVDGTNQRLIFSGRSGLASPKWSPDGQWIVFSRNDEYDECRMLGRGLCLTDEQILKRFPNLSPSDLPLVRQTEFNLAVVDIQGGNYHDVANLESARAPDWNDLGIVYQSAAGIQLTDDAPDAENRLVAFDYLNPYYADPDLQPTNGRVLFMQREASHWEIYSMNLDGSDLVALTRPVTALVDVLPSNVAPAWSPDGDTIVFVSNRGEDNSAGAWRLWVMDADGGNRRPLDTGVAIDYTFGADQTVSWGR